MAQTLINSSLKANRRPASISTLEQGLIRTFNTLQSWADRRRTRTHLYRLPDYMLRDIGISRADVVEEYEKPFWKA
jgi:uncharacterized protein YjiS (DUF1127 family)